MRKIIILPLFLVIMLFSSSAFAQSQYDFHGFAGSLDLTEIGITFNYTDGTCDGQMASTNNFTTNVGTFDSTITWRMPDATDIGFSTLTGLSNTSCLSYGRTSLKDILTDVTSGFFESSWSVSHSADSGFITTEARFVCEVPSNTINFFISNGSDSRGNCLYGTRGTTTNQRIAWLNLLGDNYNRCGDLTGWSASGTCPLSFGATCTNCQKTAQYIYPFNSSATGDVDYNITENIIDFIGTGQEVTITFTLDLINTETQTITNLHTRSTIILTEVQNFNQAEGTLSLIADTEYLLVATFNTTKAGGVNYPFTTHGPTINLSIFTFRPNYVCGEFGACVNGSQSRVCVDSFGEAPDQIETRGCFDVPFFENLLGFEQSVTDNVWVCGKDWWLVACTDRIDSIDVEFPVNWTVSGDRDGNGVIRQNYIAMSSDTSIEGSRSLKMWYIPQKPDEPVSDPGNATNTVCGNKTLGDFPETTTGFNETLFVSTNITFPAPFIDIRFDIKRCNEPPLQYDYTGDLLGINCGKRCYSFACNQTPEGRFGIRLTDIDTSDIILDYTDTAILEWKSYIIDLSDAGLQTNHNYTLAVAVNPENVLDPNSHCIYIDDVKAALRTSEITTCETVCDGLNLLLASVQGDSCVFQEIINSPTCAPNENIAGSFEEFEDVCIENDRHIFNNVTGLWGVVEDSELCISITNETAEQIADTQPLSDVTSYIEFFNFLFSPIFIYIIFSLIISGILTGGIAKITQNGDGNFQIFGISMLIFVLLGSLPGIAVIPIWITIAIITVISLLLAQKLRSFGFPGGGG